MEIFQQLRMLKCCISKFLRLIVICPHFQEWLEITWLRLSGAKASADRTNYMIILSILHYIIYIINKLSIIAIIIIILLL